MVTLAPKFYFILLFKTKEYCDFPTDLDLKSVLTFDLMEILF